MSTLGALRAASTPAMKKAMAVRLREAAEIIATAVRVAAAETKSKRIPATVKIVGGTSGLWVTAGGTDGKEAPNAYAFEEGARHPLFGNTNHWYAQRHVPFLEEGADASADKAAEAFALVIDDWQKTLDL